jgi:RimJ/RimL family protein N-acetyltransferase
LSITIRRLRAEDAAAFRTIRLEALRDSPTAFGSSHHEEAARPLEWFAAELAPEGPRAMFGAFLEERLVGIVGLAPEPAAKERHRAVIRSMFVTPAARGRGVAASLLRHVLAEADRLPGVWQVILTVTAGNHAAERLYRAHGFTLYGRLPAALHVDGYYYDDVMMLRQSARPGSDEPRYDDPGRSGVD